MSLMPNGTLDGFDHVLDFDEGLTHVFCVSAIVFLGQSFRDVASVRNFSFSFLHQLLNVLVILSHSGGLLLINLFAGQPWQLGDIGRDPVLFRYFSPRPPPDAQYWQTVDSLSVLCWLQTQSGHRPAFNIL